MFPRKALYISLKNYLANLILVWGAISLYRFFTYYSGHLSKDTQAALLFLAIGYTLIGYPLNLFTNKSGSDSKGVTVLKVLIRIPYGIKDSVNNFFRQNKKHFTGLSKVEKTTILFLIVKFFYLPIMLQFFFSNYRFLSKQLLSNDLLSLIIGVDSFNYVFFPMALSFIFLVDTLYFSFGYAIEAGFLKNTIRSVEPTLLGWSVALVCYPPFNSWLTNYTSWYANDYIMFSTEYFTFIARVAIIILLGVYVWATLALGAKCSNLTNRGIVSRGPYAFIRHPAYVSKNLAWWVTLIPIMSIPAFISMSAWSFIYYLRAITEERHLSQDPEYREYCKKVKYKFIPFVY